MLNTLNNKILKDDKKLVDKKNSSSKVAPGAKNMMFHTSEGGSKSTFAQILVETLDDSADQSKVEQEERLPGAKKTRFAMQFKLDTDKFLIDSNKVRFINDSMIHYFYLARKEKAYVQGSEGLFPD